MKVRQIMTSSPATCLLDTSIEAVSRMMAQKNCGAIPVVNNFEELIPIGVVTDRDITCRALASGRSPLDLRAKDVMTPNPVALGAEASIEECCNIMEERAIRRMPIIDQNGKCIGIVAQADIARSATEHEIAKLVRDVSVVSYAASGII